MRYWLIIILILSTNVRAQDITEVIRDTHIALTSIDLAPTLAAGECPTLHEEQDEALSTYQCHCENEIEVLENTVMELPENHLLRQRHNIRFVSIGSSFKLVNDNHLGTFIGLEGDDDGLTFGGDLGLNSVLERGQSRIKVGINYSLRQYTKPLTGVTKVDPLTNTSQLFYYDENGNYVNALKENRPDLDRQYDRSMNLYNQASMTSTLLNLDLMIERPKLPSGAGLDYGLQVGLNRISDTSDQLGARIQDNHHKSTDIYRFESKAFSNLLVNGFYNYIQIEPKVKFSAPEVNFANNTCSLKASAQFSVLFNTLIENKPHQLSIIEPKLKADVSIGIIPLKRNPETSVIELNSSVNLDPLNKLPQNANPGVMGTANLGLKFNGNLGKNVSFYIVPIEFYVPLNDPNKQNNILGGEYLEVGDRTIKAKDLENDIFATWGEIGLVFKLGAGRSSR
ncbi:MAG: hypothetical protein COW01_04485 [Bdellovibrionales bacterium CG12_big_fil_rev_8_21_14_0_65_38_15]|nr:MAG: hypothetical protein COW79_11805 [Bdellovibrionales bacterium CG22_combo_CG10-13_8_21_14_all_38_13]PIQ56315.1 MAG: hypothetical protein COW01_04485 [Bdellovibrionales bacterium CG12_big_fil_rev_8_21_14_0_65_38_15]PIR29346.1 MAG: hypothetical protein COV38_11420 [Bdellovibrionales bacterium CG11_big_fil_rev_8_21_14_0_20_38_13]